MQGTITWSVVSGPATVDANGAVTVTDIGEFQIKAVKAEDAEYNQTEALITLTAEKKPSSGGEILPTTGKILLTRISPTSTAQTRTT